MWLPIQKNSDQSEVDEPSPLCIDLSPLPIDSYNAEYDAFYTANNWYAYR